MLSGTTEAAGSKMTVQVGSQKLTATVAPMAPGASRRRRSARARSRSPPRRPTRRQHRQRDPAHSRSTRGSAGELTDRGPARPSHQRWRDGPDQPGGADDQRYVHRVRRPYRDRHCRRADPHRHHLADGDWSVAPAALTEGEHQVVVSHGSNGVKATASQTLTVDTIAPAIVIDGGSAVSTRTATPKISGRVNLPAGSTVQVVVDGVAHEVVVSPTRTWSVTSPRLTAGTHTVVVSATDAAGNVGTEQQRLTVVPVLSIDGGTARLTNDATPTISGKTDAPTGTRSRSRSPIRH